MRTFAKWFCGIVVLFTALPAFAQSPPTPGLGCAPAAHTFCVTTTVDSGAGSLRQAILDSNTTGGANTIGFAIPGAGPQTIALASQLPTINPSGNVTSLLVDGYSQPGSVLNTNAPDQGGLNTKLMIEIVGSNSYGFNYYCCPFPKIDLTYQGLALHGFAEPIFGQTYGFTPKAKLNVYGNFIGTTIDGVALPAQRNGYGVDVRYDDAQIGGAQPWQRNLISGTNGSGIYGGTPQDSIVIEGNLIGTDITGTQSIPNQIGVNIGGNYPGFRVGCTGAGCANAASRNVISGNGNYGIMVADTYNQSTGGIQIKGNDIGTDWTGTKPLPNGTAGGNCTIYCGGVFLQIAATASPPSFIGGFNTGEANVIAWNWGYGIAGYNNYVGSSFDNRGNAIHNNRSADIAFNIYEGHIANDAGDADTGTNNKQNHPVIQSASVSGTPGNLTLDVTYLVDSTTTNSTYPLRVDFYVDIDEGSGEWLGSDSYVFANATMPQTVHLLLPADVQTLVGFVASATDANGYSSEFSPSVVFDRIFANGFELPF